MGDEDWRRLIIVIIGLRSQTGFDCFHLYCQQCTGVVPMQDATGLCILDDSSEPVGEATGGYWHRSTLYTKHEEARLKYLENCSDSRVSKL